jgi:hypothetical protein
LYEEIEKVLKNEVVERHSYFQLKYFVIGKEPTLQSKLWRCLTELKTRKSAIDDINLEIEEIKDNAKLLDIEEKRLENINKCESSKKSWTQSEADEIEYREEELKIKKRKIKRKKEAISKSLKNTYKKLKFTEEEAAFFLTSFLQLSSVEGLKPYDDIDSQTEYWNNKLSHEYDLKVLLHQTPDTELVKTILALTNDSQIKQTVIKTLETRNRLMLQSQEEIKSED